MDGRRMLTRAEIDQYHRDGYVTPKFRLDQDILEDIREAHARLVHRHPQFSDYCSALLAYDPWFLTVARRSEILDMVEQVRFCLGCWDLMTRAHDRPADGRL